MVLQFYWIVVHQISQNETATITRSVNTYCMFSGNSSVFWIVNLNILGLYACIIWTHTTKNCLSISLKIDDTNYLASVVSSRDTVLGAWQRQHINGINDSGLDAYDDWLFPVKSPFYVNNGINLHIDLIFWLRFNLETKLALWFLSYAKM